MTAQITVTIDQDGNFMNAEPVDSNDKLTIIPVTEKSGSRTAGKEPHPLCDNLRYLAGDYTKYYEDDGICHELYISQLKEWVESEYCHEKVRAIYLYLKKNTLISNLIEKKIIKLNEQNRIDDKENIQGIVQTRVTNAKRYMCTFSQRPYETWKVIEESIQPYVNKLGIAERRFYENLLNDIYDLFEVESFSDNKKLDGLYLLGFHSQAYDLKQKKEDSKEKEKEE